MSTSDNFVVIGAGLAGAKAVEALRDQGFDGSLTLIGEETHHPYERPALSKGYLTGSDERGSVFVHPEAWYAEHNVDLRLGTRVTGLDRDAHRVLLDGDALPYDAALLTTGASPRTLPIPGADAEGVYYLRSLEDSEALSQLFTTAQHVAIIGAGWIGLEVTAAARKAGVAVTVVESAELPLLRVLGPELAAVFAGLHREHDVDFRFKAELAEITTEGGRANGVRLADGSTIDADAVLVAVGVGPNTGLAEAAGLEVDNGIVVSDALRSNDPAIYAAGDVARFFHPLYGKHIRVEHWANALNQPATAATAMLGGEASYSALPYFYTDQYDLGMEYVGLVEPYGYDDLVIRGDLSSREFVAFWMSEGRVLAGMNVNVWDVTEDIKGLYRGRRVIDTAKLADPAEPLGTV